MSRLSTHVLDTAAGRPAGNMRIHLSEVHPGGGETLIVSTATNDDGRTDAPLLDSKSMRTGRFVLRFEAGRYFRERGVALPDPPFLDEIAIAFGIADAAAGYHVPLLVSPWSYSTYRGS